MENLLELHPLLRQYCESHSTKPSDGLLEVERTTHLNNVKRLDASDVIQGRLLSFISHLIQPKSILEIGTFTAYATGCLAEGLHPEGGSIVSIERNELFKNQILHNLEELGIAHLTEVLFGSALEIIPRLNKNFDLIFIDAAKQEYSSYFDLLIDRMNSGGVIIADNILWKGRVLAQDKDRASLSIHQFNQKIANDTRVEVIMLPYRDGISFIRKK